MLKLEVEHYIQLGEKMRERAAELCRMYMKVHYDCDDCSVLVTNMETGQSGRFGSCSTNRTRKKCSISLPNTSGSPTTRLPSG